MATTVVSRSTQARATENGVTPCDASAIADEGGRGVGQPALAYGAVGHGRDLARPQQGDEVELGAAFGDIVEDLVGGAGVAALAQQLLHVAGVEIADTPAPDLPGAHQGFHPLDGLRERDRAAPVQQVEVQVVRAQPLEASVASSFDPAAPRVLRIDLADQEHLVAKAH